MPHHYSTTILCRIALFGEICLVPIFTDRKFLSCHVTSFVSRHSRIMLMLSQRHFSLRNAQLFLCRHRITFSCNSTTLFIIYYDSISPNLVNNR